MKRLIIYSILSVVTLCSYGQSNFNKTEIKSIMKRVADWQIANPATGAEHDDLNWTYAALYMGMIDWAELTEKEDGDSQYYNWLLKIGRRNAWQMGKYMYHADFIAVGQVFLEMYQKYNDRNMMFPTLARTEFVINHPSASTLELDYRNMASLERWSWCDALFMAPPVYAKMYMLTNDWKYIEFMNREYKATYDYLFDKEEELFYRDHRYFKQKEANGKKVFWGRGNGWVLGGLCEILQTLPEITCTANSTRISSSPCPTVSSGCRARTDIGMQVCWTQTLILHPKQVPLASLSMHWPMVSMKDCWIKPS